MDESRWTPEEWSFAVAFGTTVCAGSARRLQETGMARIMGHLRRGQQVAFADVFGSDVFGSDVFGSDVFG